MIILADDLGYGDVSCNGATKINPPRIDQLATNRLALGFEYTARYNLGNDVTYEPYRSVSGKYFYPQISPDSRGSFAPIYDRVYSHYQGRLGLEMPYCRQAMTKSRSESRDSAHVPASSLMFAELGANQLLIEPANSPFVRSDSNHDVFFVLAEFQHALNLATGVKERITELDKNADGKLSPTEFFGSTRPPPAPSPGTPNK